MRKGLDTFNETVGADLKHAQEFIDKIDSEVTGLKENQGNQLEKHQTSIEQLLEQAEGFTQKFARAIHVENKTTTTLGKVEIEIGKL